MARLSRTTIPWVARATMDLVANLGLAPNRVVVWASLAVD
jgi:hypothetical protein